MRRLGLDMIRVEIEGYVGKKVRLTADKGRNRIVVKEGVLDSAYPNVFTVKVNDGYDGNRTISYSYSDVLTSAVKLALC